MLPSQSSMKRTYWSEWALFELDVLDGESSEELNDSVGSGVS